MTSCLNPSKREPEKVNGGDDKESLLESTFRVDVSKLQILLADLEL